MALSAMASSLFLRRSVSAAAAFGSSSARIAPRLPSAINKNQKRGMALGGHHGPPPEWTGVDKVVRGYFPEDYQLAIAILSGYGGLIVLFKIKSAMSSKKVAPAATAPAPAPAAAATDADAGVPAVDSPAFEKYVESEAFYKLLEDEAQLGKLVESL